MGSEFSLGAGVSFSRIGHLIIICILCLTKRIGGIFTVLMVIAQMLFLIEKKSYNNAAERIYRLKSYANRQLKKEEYFRTIQFIRLLQQLVKADFQIENLSNVDKYYNRLIEEPFFYRGLISELEVLPMRNYGIWFWQDSKINLFQNE